MKKSLSIILSILLLSILFVFSISAASEPTIQVGSAEAKRGETVTLDIQFLNNPGFNTYSLSFLYDETQLELVECENVLGGIFDFYNKAVWLASEDTTYSGTFLRVTFKVLEAAAYGDTQVTVSYGSGEICNYDEEDIAFAVKPGKITVHEHSYTGKTTKSATCTMAGVTTYTCACGDSYTKPIPATGKHTGGTATCKAKAICTVCKQSYGNYAGHNSNTTIPAVAATYKATGLTEGKKCSVCGTVTVAQKTIAKLTLGKIDGLKAKKVKVAKKSEITLTWNSLGEGVKYEVYVKNGKKWKKLTTTSKTSYTVKKDGKNKSLKADKEYQFRVRAVVDSIKGTYSKTLTVETVPATTSLKLKAGKKQLTASWSKVSDISGYEVQYSTSKKFTKKTTKTISAKKASKKTTIKKLSKGKKYYVRIRTYKTVDGKKIYSDWSKVKNVKVK